jgi:hypothetical protein
MSQNLVQYFAQLINVDAFVQWSLPYHSDLLFSHNLRRPLYSCFHARSRANESSDHLLSLIFLVFCLLLLTVRQNITLHLP